ncbi:hypothetical protein MMYC01_208977 [Madurella mycetomatis]|uniref:Uncharacterized protein n=1 Tax=Madurella mycetomatis TaxID=100816 RepID=A0A175VWF1_9PEZI|nr:hypothetical protein MMYC01_208977 [Madurella mycetomatis]
MAWEQKQEQEEGILPYYCIGSSARPFNPPTDTFWFNQESHLVHPLVRNLDCVIGNRIHTIKNLAISLECITIDTGRPQPSTWNWFRWDRLYYFVNLRRVDVVFEETLVDNDDEVKNNGSRISAKMPEFRLEKWTRSPWATSTLDDPEAMVDKVRGSVLQVFQDAFKRKEVKQEELPLPDGAPDWHDGSEITFHAARMAKIGG